MIKHITVSGCCFQGHLPFAVVGSTEEVKIGNKMVKARQYPWGVVQGMLCVRLWVLFCFFKLYVFIIDLLTHSCCYVFQWKTRTTVIL